MLNLKNYFTASERRLLSIILAIAFIIILINQFGIDRLYSDNVNSDSLKTKLQKDYIIKIDIRTATVEELCQIKGIGEKTAQKIIDYRKENTFESTEDLLKVKGIGKKTLEKMKPNLVIFPVRELQTSDTLAVINASINHENKLDINHASIPDLCQIKGIGEKKAKAILDYRNQINFFTNMEQLLEIKGIGKKTLAKIKEKFFIESKKQ